MIGRRSGSIVATMNNPEYTGANRCVPCTVVNVLLATALAGIVGFLAGGRTVEGWLAAGFVLLGSLGIIYARGYLLPGTPELTKRYLPESVLAWFDKTDAIADGPHDPEPTVRAIGVVTDDQELGDLVLTTEFEDAWLEAIVERAATDEDLRTGLADVMELDPDSLEVERRPTSFAAVHEGTLVARWESRAACQADVAAALILPRFDRRWHGRSVPERLDLLATLRLFLEECPACGGAVSLAHEVVESCCRSRNVVATTCDACAARLIETPIDADVLESDEPEPEQPA